MLGNAQQTAGSVLGSAQQAAGDTKREVQAGNPLAVGGLGALAGALLGGVRGSPAKGALGGAAMAVLGQIAMSALQKGMGGGGGAAQPGLAEPAASAGGYQDASVEELTGDARAELLLRAMINAAKADGQIDGTEMNNILGKLDEAGAGQETKDFVLAEMRRPLDLDGLIAGVNSPDTRGRGLRGLGDGDQGRHPRGTELSRPAGHTAGHPAAGAGQPRRQPWRRPSRLIAVGPVRDGAGTGRPLDLHPRLQAWCGRLPAASR